MTILDKLADRREQFERAFGSGVSGCYRECACGRAFYNDDDMGSWSWEPGELEQLRANQSTISLPHAVGSVILAGREYVTDCECWNALAMTVVNFLDGHERAIAEWFKLEKAQRQFIADMTPTIET